MARAAPQAGLYIFGQVGRAPCKIGNTYDLARRLSYLRRVDATPTKLGLDFDQSQLGYVHIWKMAQPVRPLPTWSGGMPGLDVHILRQITCPRLTVGARTKNGKIWQRQTEWFALTPDELKVLIEETTWFQRSFGERVAWPLRD